MSDEEKERQIGRLVLAAEAARRDAAHLSARASEIQAAYAAFAHALLTPGAIRPSPTDSSRLVIVQQGATSQALSANLLAEAELAAFVREREASSEKLRSLNARLSALGIALKPIAG